MRRKVCKFGEAGFILLNVFLLLFFLGIIFPGRFCLITKPRENYKSTLIPGSRAECYQLVYFKGTAIAQ